VGILATDTREQSGIWSTSSGVLGAYRALGALDSTRGELIDPATFCDDANTLYVCASGRDQAMLAPLVVGLIGEVQSAAYARAGQGRPLLLALDELANIAPLPDLPQLVSEGGGQGVLTIGCLQDLSQARARWGATADGFLSLFSTTLVLGGVADRGTLITLRDLAGQHEIGRPSSSTSRDARGRRSSSVSLTINREERLGLDEAARLETGTALLLDAAKQLGRIELTAAYRDEPWRSLIGPGRARAELGRVR
jgi:type IV secretory pathway TraG/TraD family ATPase VirD4